MNKKKILLVVLVIAVGILMLWYPFKNQTIDKDYCNEDSDCVPKTCCHPDSCTNKNFKPDCSGIMCTQECTPNTLDCGQGECKCINNKCQAIIENGTSTE